MLSSRGGNLSWASSHSATACPFLHRLLTLSLLKDFYKPFMLHENLNPYGLAFKSHRH